VAVTHVFAGIPVADFEAARAWYEALLQRPPDMVPHETEVAWQLTDSGWVYVVQDRERAGRALVTVLVDDLDALDVDGERETVPGKYRNVVVTDPDGNRIQFAQPLS
jgi:catechol 2,3-dioxygenase-like lactoylglutathione lyase family enzyme